MWQWIQLACLAIAGGITNLMFAKIFYWCTVRECHAPAPGQNFNCATNIWYVACHGLG